MILIFVLWIANVLKSSEYCKFFSYFCDKIFILVPLIKTLFSTNGKNLLAFEADGQRLKLIRSPACSFRLVGLSLKKFCTELPLSK